MVRCLGSVSGRIYRKVSGIVVHQNSGRGREHTFCGKKKKVGSFSQECDSFTVLK